MKPYHLKPITILRVAILGNKDDEYVQHLYNEVRNSTYITETLDEIIEATKKKYILHCQSGKNIPVQRESILGKTLTKKEGNKLTTYKYRTHMNPEDRFIQNLLYPEISGICSMCGEPIFFGESHHIFGRDLNEFTVFLCNECHITDGNKQLEYHCMSIGRRIEWGALTYPQS